MRGGGAHLSLSALSLSRFNRFGKWSKKGTAMGFGVFPWVSYFNHSCIPNLRRYQGENFGLLEVRAIRPIEAGEELCISYTDLHLTTNDRRSVLRVHAHSPESRLPFL
jgi:hypothetical protein